MVEKTGNLDVDVIGIEYDSRKVKGGSVFVAIKGFQQNGAEFVGEAVKNGAVGVVLDEEAARSLVENKEELNTSAIIVEDSRIALASLSADFYGRPSRELQVIGITGTNGKTTITYIVESILRECGKETGVIGTVNYRFGDKTIPAMQTTPESLDLQRMFREMVGQKVDCCILEVSSHSLALDRVYKTDFTVGIFTNLTQDHLDFHHTTEDYFKAKEKLFTDYHLKKAVINIDDLYGKKIAGTTSAKTITVGIEQKADINADYIETSIEGIKFVVQTPIGEAPIVSSLIGKHNIYNILCAIGTAISLGISLDDIKKGVASLNKIPGRFEKINEGQDFAVIVDYAHTDDALKNVLVAAKELTDKRVIAVFGCGGDRDRDKRHKMGKVAGELSDYSIITSDNPRNEEPASITYEIEKGIKLVTGKENYCVTRDRKEAIGQAIKMAEKGDLVIIAGKGHENYQLIKGKRNHFDDCEVARELIKKRFA